LVGSFAAHARARSVGTLGVIRWWCSRVGPGRPTPQARVFNKPSPDPHHHPPVCCVLLCCAVLSLPDPSSVCDSASLDCLLYISVAVACSCYRVVACVCLVHCVATPILDHLPVNLSRQLHEHSTWTTCSHIIAQDRQHGVCLAAAHPLSMPHLLTLRAANLEALATSSTRVAVAKQNSMLLVAAPSVHTRRTAGSITPGGVEYIHSRPTK